MEREREREREREVTNTLYCKIHKPSRPTKEDLRGGSLTVHGLSEEKNDKEEDMGVIPGALKAMF